MPDTCPVCIKPLAINHYVARPCEHIYKEWMIEYYAEDNEFPAQTYVCAHRGEGKTGPVIAVFNCIVEPERIEKLLPLS